MVISLCLRVLSVTFQSVPVEAKNMIVLFTDFGLQGPYTGAAISDRLIFHQVLIFGHHTNFASYCLWIAVVIH